MFLYELFGGQKMRYSRIIALIFGIFLCALIFVSVVKYSKFYNPYPGKPIHLFFEGLATMPALMGMIDMVQLPKDELKIFAWHRFPKRHTLVDLKSLNAIEIPITHKEGLPHYSGRDFTKQIQKYLKEHPKSPVILYTNINNVSYFTNSFLAQLPKERVKHLHLYEDGFGELITSQKTFQNMPDLTEIGKQLEKFIYDPKNNKNPKYGRHAFHLIYPTTYHFGLLSDIKNLPEYAAFIKQMEKATLLETDFYAIQKKLSNAQKKLLFQLAGFDYDYYKAQFKNKKTFMIFGALYYEKSHQNYHAEMNYMKELQKIYPNHTFLFKPHPSYDAYDRSKIINKIFPNVISIPAQMPFELFLISGLKPDKVAGAASSLFYSLTDDDIIGYFPHGSYQNGFNKYKKFKKHKILRLNMFTPENPLFFDNEVIENEQKDYIIFTSPKNVYFYKQKMLYPYIIKNNKMFVTFNETQQKIYEKKENTYYYIETKEIKNIKKK